MIIMFLFSPAIASFVQKHPTVKMLALSFLILIAFTLIVDGVHLQEFEIPHGYVYFAMAFSLGVETLNIRMLSKRTDPLPGYLRCQRRRHRPQSKLGLRVVVSAAAFKAKLSVTTHGNKQTVSISSEGAVKGASISLSRA
jgi:hypothetical protein